MYLKDKKTVTIGSMLIDEENDKFIVLRITSTGRFLLEPYLREVGFYFMCRDFKVRGTDNKIIFRLELIKKIKYKRKRYKNG